MSADEKRRSLMERLLGKRAGSEAAKTMSELIKILTEAGIDTKEMGKPKTKGILEDMKEQVDALLEGITEDAEMRNELGNQLIATIMGALANVEPAEELEPVEEVPEMMQAEDEEEEEEELPEKFMELAEQVKELAAENTDFMEEMKAFIPAVIEMAGVVKALTPLVKSTEEITRLVTRLDEIEALLKMTPKQASRDASTLFSNDQLEREIKKGTDGKKFELGIPLKE